jgi:hypothetical protein
MEAQFAHVLNQWNDCKRGRAVEAVVLVLEEPLRTLKALCDDIKLLKNYIAQLFCIY